MAEETVGRWPELGNRSPGDPIPPRLVRAFRQREDLTQEQLANRLGVRGGKAVISGWETGRSPCEGPAAEFLLHLMGRSDAAVAATGLRNAMTAQWERTGEPVRRWYQVACIPELPPASETAAFVKLFPDAALDDGDDGFPFARGFLHDCIGMTPEGWVGCIPFPENEQPTYLWMLRRDFSFAFRSRVWEDDPMSSARGNFDVGWQILRAAQTALLFKKLLPSINPEAQFSLHLDLAGVRGRGLVNVFRPRPTRLVRTWAQDETTASVLVSANELFGDPLGVAIRLTIELAAQIGSDFASEQAMRAVIEDRRGEERASEFNWMLRLAGAEKSRRR
jgi:transcriptional regulator with XRE-family HTH domain